MRLKAMIILSLLFCSNVLTGCVSTLPIAINKEDVFLVPSNSTITYPDGRSDKVSKRGRFFSDDYIREIIGAKVK